jgi:hypothetical protein
VVRLAGNNEKRGTIGAARYRPEKCRDSFCSIPVWGNTARHAAFGPATGRMLRGQPAGFEEPMVLTKEVTSVGSEPVGRAAAR